MGDRPAPAPADRFQTAPLASISASYSQQFNRALLLPRRTARRVRREPWLGAFNYYDVPVWCVIASVVILDFAIYLQHVMFHAVPTCGACTACITPISISTSHRRALPSIEILLSMLIKFAVIASSALRWRR